MPDFDATNPPKTQTNPDGPRAGTVYPRHLFKRVDADDETGLIVAWAGKTPIRNGFVEALNAGDEAAFVAAGYALDPVVDTPAAAPVAKAKK